LNGRGDDDGNGGEESGGFADLVADVKPLKGRSHRRPMTKPRPVASGRGPTAERAGFRFPDSDEPRLAAAPGVSNRVLHALGRGDPSFEERVDLHGLDREGARRHLARALESAAFRGLRCVLVVHGVGRGSAGGAVLLDATPKWLAKPPCADRVLAFAPAQRKDGGAGATYVLLRRSV